MRIGVRLRPTTASGVLMDRDSDRVVASGSVPAPPSEPERLTALLHDLGSAVRSSVTSVTWDVSAVLEDAVIRAARAGRDGPTGDAGRQPMAGPVAAVRVIPKPPDAPTISGHPAAPVRSLVAWRGTVTGGHDLFGNELARLDLEAAERCAQAARDAGLTTLAVTAMGAAALADHEQSLAAHLLERFPDLRVFLSHELGGLGLLEREATTVLNAALIGVAEYLVSGCERATRAVSSRASCWFATGDGGRVSGKRLRWLPAVGLAATGAAAMIGAARLSASTDALVVMTGPATLTIGQVRGGLPHLEPNLPGSLGIRVAAPQPVLAESPVEAAASVAAHLGEHTSQSAAVVAVLDEGGREAADRILAGVRSNVTPVRPDGDLAAVGAACTEPSAWLDLWVTAATRQELHQRQSQAEQRALTVVASNGARPGSERIVSSVATSMGFLSSDLYRLLVRASSSPGPGGGR